MSDLISRQAAETLFRNARKALMEQSRKEHIKDFNTRDLMLLNAEQLIHLLPSVEPEIEKCDDCISRIELLKKINSLCNNTCEYSQIQRKSMCDSCNLDLVFDMINNAKSVEPERKTGKWISEQPWCLPKCSICGASCFGLHGFDAIKTPYCPTCGAKMEVDG